MAIAAAMFTVICILVFLFGTNHINSVDCYTGCVGLSGLYIIIQHTLGNNINTDKFLIYFSFVLFWAILAGYIPFKHYQILILILYIEVLFFVCYLLSHIIILFYIV